MNRPGTERRLFEYLRELRASSDFWPLSQRGALERCFGSVPAPRAVQRTRRRAYRRRVWS